ncbi:MAG: 1,4-alpha-glucan branching protein GlgB [Sarcina sp.]
MFTEYDSYLFHEGKNYSCYKFMGSHIKVEGKKQGVRFTTWAPNAKSVYIVGDFCNWKIRKKYALEKCTDNGLWSIFIKEIKKGAVYKYAIETKEGEIILKADPFARQSELRPMTASIVTKANNYKWHDKEWRKKRVSHYKNPMNIYEVHLGSWRTNGEKFLTYSEIAELLPSYLSEMGYTHVEFLPIMEHPLDSSWGYQVTGFYSPTSRFGTADELRYLIDKLHQYDIGVILDWVPGHFCRDAHGLAKFDGDAVYEYQEEWKANNSGWGTLNFDLGRPEVKSFLISNAIYYLKEFHFDGIRVDAVSNMIYLNYGRNDHEWIVNEDGDNVNKYGLSFIKELNTAVKEKVAGAIMCAEESTTWPKVSSKIEDGGLGFDFKWNMGWMNDTLKYIELDPIYRKYEHNKLTFAMMYNYDEHFILPISHDEVVHGKKSMLDKMWGDYWTKFASLRLYRTYMIGHAGKKLSFMGMEFGQFIEWREYEDLDWHLAESYETHTKMHKFFKDLNHIYKKSEALWKYDYDLKGFEWIEPNNGEQSVYIFMRKSDKKEDTLIFVCNFTPVTYEKYRIGIPYEGKYVEIINSDSVEYGGLGNINTEILKADIEGYHNQKYSMEITVPPMGACVFKMKRRDS